MNADAPFELLAAAVRRHGSPLWAYDARTIIDRIEKLHGFDTVRYAQKANPNLHILRLMRERGVVLDAVSWGEVERAFAAGASVDGDPAGVVLTCDLLDQTTLARVIESRIEVNVGSIDMLRQLGSDRQGIGSGSVSIPGSAMVTVARPTREAKIASMVSGTNNWKRHSTASALGVCTW